MTRVFYALALLLLALGGPLVVTSPARCQTSADEYGFGSRYYYYKTCPVVDGYIQTHGEDYQPDSANAATSDTATSDTATSDTATSDTATSDTATSDTATSDTATSDTATSDTATSDTDLRGRSVVAVLDDPAAVATQCVQSSLPEDLASDNVGSSAEKVTDDVQAIETQSTVTNSDNQPVVDYHGCYEEYINPCQSNSVVGNETECPKAETEASNEVRRDDVPQYSKPYDAYDYGYRFGGSAAGGCPSIHNYGYRYGGADAGICPSINTEAVAEVVTEAVVNVLPVMTARDCENECYQAYLQQRADEAATQSVVDEAAAAAAEPTYDCEPYDAYGYESGYSDPSENGGYEQESVIEAPTQDQPESTAAATPPEDTASYEVYDYYHGIPETVVSKPQQSGEPAPSVPHYYGRYPYGYGYEYDYEYSKEYHSDVQADEGAEPAVTEPAVTEPAVMEPAVMEPAVTEPAVTEPAVTEPAVPQDADVLQSVDLGREFLGSIVESDLVDLVRAEAERVLAQVADAVETMNFDQVRKDATQAMAAAVQQPLPAPSDSNDANMFLFMFDSDLNADPVAVSGLKATPWMVDDQIVDEQPQDEQDAAIVEPVSDDSVSIAMPINRELVLQWARNAVDSAVMAWDRLTIELQRFASRSMATVPADDASPTQR